MESNPYEKKYKQLNLLGKGNYGTADVIQARCTRCVSTTAKRARMPPTSWPRKCSLKAFPRKTSRLHTDKYFFPD